MRINLLEEQLKANNISRKDFEEMIKEMRKNPVDFIVKEIDSKNAKKKNVVKSIFQSIHNLKAQKFVVDKLELPYLRFVILSTAAGGHAISQRHRSGGIILHSGDKRIHLDPGPSAVRDCEDYSRFTGENWDPILTDALALTHNHIDHAGGAEEYVETWISFSNDFAAKKKIFSNVTSVEGNIKFGQGPRFDKYKRAKIEGIYALSPGDTKKLGDIEIKATKAVHVEGYDPETKNKFGECLGFVIKTPYGRVGITGDTEYHDSISEDLSGVDYLFAYIVQERSRVSGEPERWTVEEIGKINIGDLHIQFLGEIGVENLLKEIKPKACFLTHYGDQFATFERGRLVYKSIPIAIAKRIENNTGIKTIPCLDGMTLDIDRGIKKKISEEYFSSSNRMY